MATAPAPRSVRDFCSQCGFLTKGSRCDACGAPHDPLGDHDDDDVPTAEKAPRPYGSPAESDVSGLDRAIDAFRAKDLPRFVEHLLLGEASAPPRAATTPDGPGWVATVRGALLFVTLRTDEVIVEAPIARLPARANRLPALRLALELCAGSAASSRVAARGDLLLLRWNARLALLTPPVLRHHVREIAHLACRYGSLLTVGLDARPPFADEQRSAAAFDMIGRPRRLHVGGRRSMLPAPIPGRAEPAPQNPSKARNGGGRPIPRQENETTSPGLSPDEAAAAGNIPKPRHPLSDRPSSGDAIPAILAPMGSVRPRPSVDPYPSESRSAPAESRAAPADSGRRAPSASFEPAPDGRPRTGRTEIEIDTLSRRPGVPSMPSFDAVRGSDHGGATSRPSDASLSPSDRLCMLLRHAQSMASFTLEERPATMVWLVRSAVFRAIYDFKDILPDAVAQLYRCTGIGRELPAPGTRVSGQLQAAEPALVVMERVIVARGQVPKEKPLAIEPMTSAAQAKEHVARYLGEIERAPSDPPLRHFLALGALTELLVRTKLPAQTDQRLRDIVSHAQREGAKSSAIDLMMTALQRINS